MFLNTCVVSEDSSFYVECCTYYFFQTILFRKQQSSKKKDKKKTTGQTIEARVSFENYFVNAKKEIVIRKCLEVQGMILRLF